MIITGTGDNTTALVHEFPETTGLLFEAAENAIKAGSKAMGFEKFKIVGDVLYTHVEDLPVDRYLAIAPKEKRIFQADQHFQPVLEDTDVWSTYLEMLAVRLKQRYNLISR